MLFLLHRHNINSILYSTVFAQLTVPHSALSIDYDTSPPELVALCEFLPPPRPHHLKQQSYHSSLLFPTYTEWIPKSIVSHVIVFYMQRNKHIWTYLWATVRVVLGFVSCILSKAAWTIFSLSLSRAAVAVKTRMNELWVQWTSTYHEICTNKSLPSSNTSSFLFKLIQVKTGRDMVYCSKK